MEFKQFLDAFIRYNKRIYIKLIIISILLFYFAFLISYNLFRIEFLQLGISDQALINVSWGWGTISALISTLILILIVDIIRVLFLLHSEREH
jgi:hypothetical protein